MAGFLEALDDFAKDVTDQSKALRFYASLSTVKLYVVLEYGYPKTKLENAKKVILVYTTEPDVANEAGLSTIALGVERLAQELVNLEATGLLVDEGKRNVIIPAENVFQIQALKKKAADFELKTMPEQLALTLENAIRRVVKASPMVLSAWLLGILLPEQSEYKYMVTLEYDPTVSVTEKQQIEQQLAEQVVPLLPAGEEILIGTTDELAGQRAKAEFAPFYIKLNF